VASTEEQVRGYFLSRGTPYLDIHPDYNFSECCRRVGAQNTHTSSEPNVPLTEFDVQGFHALATSGVER
jgi:hypothetical protein